MDSKQTQDQLEQKIIQTTRKPVPEPEPVNQKMQEAYDKIRKTQPARNKKLSVVVRFSTVAAILAFAMIYCVKNPAIAAQIPWIGNIFRELEGKISFPGDYSAKSIRLDAAYENNGSVKQNVSGDKNDARQTEERAGSGKTPQAGAQTDRMHAGQTDAQTDRMHAGQTDAGCSEKGTECWKKEVNGVTVTLSEVAYDYDAIYLAIQVQNEKGFAKDATYPDILFYDAQVKLKKSDGSMEEFAFETEGIYTVGIEGEYTDAHTFQGIYRFGDSYPDISEYTDCELTFLEFEQLLPTGETEIITVPDYGEVSRLIPDSVHYKGPWSFHISLEDMEVKEQEIAVNEVNDKGFGIEKIVKTEFAIYAVPILPEGKTGYDYVATIWDADGNPLENRDFGEYLTMSHYRRDISTVTVYLLKVQDFLDNKAENAYLQPGKAVYQTTVRLKD